jgi:hypothetical protein
MKGKKKQIQYMYNEERNKEMMMSVVSLYFCGNCHTRILLLLCVSVFPALQQWHRKAQENMPLCV